MVTPLEVIFLQEVAIDYATIIMARQAFVNPITGRPRRAAKRERSKNSRWMHNALLCIPILPGLETGFME